MTFATNHTDNKKIGLDLLLWPTVILLLGLSLTGIASHFASIKDAERSLAEFNLHTQDATINVQKRINIYFGVLHSAAGLFAASKSVTRAEWEQYVSFIRPRENYPGIEGMGFIRLITNGQKRKFENAVGHEKSSIRKAGYTIHPSGEREAYYPVEYFWPPLPHIDLLGLDHGAYPAGLKALEVARDSGVATVSEELPYAQGGDSMPPILFLFPVYRNGLPATTVDERRRAILGFAYARVNMAELFRDAINPSIIREIDFRIYDANQENSILDTTRLMYDSVPSDAPQAQNASYKPNHTSLEKIAVGDSSWLLYSASRPGRVTDSQNKIPLLILLAGSLLSISTSIVVFMRDRQGRLIHQLAYYDHLTGLPNRGLLKDRFQQALANAQRHGTGMALLFLDLDKFKPINDSLGHEAGDKVLKVVAARLTSCLREGDTLSRLGGDEFVVLLLNTASEEEVSSVAQKLIDITSGPISMKECDFQVGCSIGISIFPKDGASYDALLKSADAAMYCAKESGRNTFRFYPGMLSMLALVSDTNG